VYKRNANSLSEEIRKAFPDAQITINPNKPRSKSFEVSLVKEGGEGKVLGIAHFRYSG